MEQRSVIRQKLPHAQPGALEGVQRTVFLPGAQRTALDDGRWQMLFGTEQTARLLQFEKITR